ncbi:methyltransferase [Aliifodinibius salicampi]|uniref:Methyltransferase n=1 Tax=Fodinibius salicampi TaxID=1920655 RepID=A0ABT3Q2M7_9BACT|nr:methyltransferase [Fodinibius salicampi]MCW9714369.1 methyltransferase [Fodinibius salicampi]
MSTLAYLKSFFKDKDVASVTPTSKYCVRRVCNPINFDQDINIVEYGAGAGVFSRYLLQHMTPGSKLYLFETNEILFGKLKEIDDSRITLFDNSVEYAKELIPDDQIGKIDYIISGIPFSFLDEDARESVLKQSVDLLKEGGRFLAYQTSGHLEEPLQKAFGNVKTGWEWRNIPPMTIYEAEKRKMESTE